MTEFRVGRPGEEEEIIDLINLTFSHDHRPHDFPTLLPKLYSKENFHPEYHYLAIEDGKIRASIGSYPNTAYICGHELKSRDLGAVSVHPYYRSKGYMRTLMDMLLHDMEQEGCVMSWLGGQRQRYGYWGYERIGVSTGFHVSATNLRHMMPGRTPVWTVRELTREDPALAEAETLHAARNTRFVRHPFYDFLTNFDCKPYGLFDAEGKLQGYAVRGNGTHCDVQELVLRDEADLDEAVVTLVADSGAVDLNTYMWEITRNERLHELCEGYHFGAMEQCRIIRFEPVLKAALALQSSYRKTPDCEFSFRVEETGETLRLCWKNGLGTVEPAEKADFVWSRRRAESYLFALQPGLNLPAGMPASALTVLPLPIYTAHPDAV